MTTRTAWGLTTGREDRDMSDDGEILDDRPWTRFAEGKVGCPVCAEQLPVPVLARIEGEAQPHLDLKPDMTELWSHIWAHEEAGR